MNSYLFFSNRVQSIKQEQSGKAGHENHLDGIDFQDEGAEEGGKEESDADPELPGIF